LATTWKIIFVLEFLLCQWWYKNWFWEYINHALYPLLLRTYNRNKFENSNKERTNFLLQDKWNNFFKKTCGCKAHSYCKNVWKRSKLFAERNRRKTIGKEKMIFFGGSISKFFSAKDSFKKKDVPQKAFLENLGLLIVKNNLPIQFVENMWLKHLILHLCPKLNFPSIR